MRDTEKELAPEIASVLERLPGAITNFAGYAETAKTINLKIKATDGLTYVFASLYRAKYRPKKIWCRLRRFSANDTRLDMTQHEFKSYTKGTTQHIALCGSVAEAVLVLAQHARDYERLVTSGNK